MYNLESAKSAPLATSHDMGGIMKKRVVPILAVTAALILVTGLAYAADKKKHGKQRQSPPDLTPDDESIRAELLSAVEGQQETTAMPAGSKSRKVARVASGPGSTNTDDNKMK